MKLPKKLIIKKNESKEIQEIKKTLNDLLDFHYEFHNLNSSGSGGGRRNCSCSHCSPGGGC